MITEAQVRERKRDGSYILGIECISCHKEQPVKVTGPEMYALQTSSKKIQDILPNHSPDVRELFVSGCCGFCWKEIFSEEY